MSQNYYNDLGVDETASRDEIRQAHRERLAALQAQRDEKGVTDAQLEQNREEAARVRAAWNVLSDPFQRQRYDAQLASERAADEDEDEGGGESGNGSEPRTEIAVTGWRKIFAPPPPRQSARQSGGKSGSAPASRRQRPEPTIVLPAGLQLAEPKARGMAMLFDIAVIAVIYTAVLFLLPNVLQSDYKTTSKQIDKVNTLHDKQSTLEDAQKALKSAETKGKGVATAQNDVTKAKKDVAKAKKDAEKESVHASALDGKSASQLQKLSDKLSSHIRGTTYLMYGVVFILAILYLVPLTARTGRSLGMRNRNLKVVRVDGSPVGWTGSILRFAPPVLLALAIPQIGPLFAFGMVGWAFFDRNRMGLHDKLARTVVVAA